MKTSRPKSTPHDFLPLLEKKEFRSTIPIDRQVATHLRDLILEHKIPADTELPPIRAMAALWETNYHTVHDALTRLVAEGLIVMRPGQGSFVAPARRVLRRVCLYHNYQMRASAASEDFYTHLNVYLYGQLSKRDVAIVPYYDQRVFERLHIAPPPIRKMASEGEIDAVIAIDIFPEHTGWLHALEVPVATLMSKEPGQKVEIDINKLAHLVIEQAVKSNRKTLGLIHSPINAHLKGRRTDLFRVELERLAAENGITVITPAGTDLPPLTHRERVSARLCEQLLQAPIPPDMIFVYPDSYLRGVTTELLKHHIDVPGQILLVSHRNAESALYVPFPMTWLTVKIVDFTAALVEQIDRQIAGNKVGPTTIDVQVEQTVPEQF